MKPDPTINIIIVNYLTWKHTLSCIGSIAKSDYLNFWLWVVDVEDHDDSSNRISDFLKKENLSNSTIINIPQNVGFAGANNAALAKILAKSPHDFVWLLNNDTVIQRSTIGELVEKYTELVQDEIPVGIMGSKICDASDKNKLQAVGGRFRPLNGRIKLIGYGEIDQGQYDGEPFGVDFLMGASLFLSVEALQKIGLMDERYFLYCEDLDWCITARLKGYRNFACTSAVIYHEQGVTTGTKYTPENRTSENLRYLHSSYLKLYRKFYLKYLPVAWFQMARQMLSLIFHGRCAESKVLLSVLFQNIFRR